MKLLSNNGTLKNKLKLNNKKMLAVAGLSIALSMNPSIEALAVPNITVEDEVTGHIEPGYGIELDMLTGIKFDTNEFYTGNHLSVDDLSHVKELSFRYNPDRDYSFLNQMVNIEKLYIGFDTNEIDLNEVNCSRWKNPVNIELNPIFDATCISEFNEESFNFLKTIPRINKLQVGYEDVMGYMNSFIINQSFIESFTNADTLDLYITDYSNYNYKDLSNYKNVILHGKPYDVIMYMNCIQLGELIRSGVNVQYQYAQELCNIDIALQDVISKLDIAEGSTDKERLDAILEFILYNYEYSKAVSEDLSDGIADSVDCNQFYENGFLDGAFRNHEIICGNYAALVASLCNYEDIDAYIVESGDHAFNEVVLSGNPYVVDATWIDGEKIEGTTAADMFKAGEQDVYYLPYYLTNPNDLYNLRWYDSHCPWITQNDYYVDKYDFTEMYYFLNNAEDGIVLSDEKVRTK